MKLLISLFTGMLFGSGLLISGMADRNKALGFLDIFGTWDPSLLFVMIGAMTVSIPGFLLCFRLKQPLFERKFSFPQITKIDKALVLGAVLFGLGWGLYGYCPGPAIASLAVPNLDNGLFVLAMFSGLYLGSQIKKILTPII